MYYVSEFDTRPDGIVNATQIEWLEEIGVRA